MWLRPDVIAMRKAFKGWDLESFANALHLKKNSRLALDMLTHAVPVDGKTISAEMVYHIAAVLGCKATDIVSAEPPTARQFYAADSAAHILRGVTDFNNDIARYDRWHRFDTVKRTNKANKPSL